MALRTRIALTFLLLLAAVLAAALGAVSAVNRANAAREVQRQLTVGVSAFSRLLENNRRQLTQAAQAVAADYGFREAVAARDVDTLASALENSGARIGAALVVLTSLDGRVLAEFGAHATVGGTFPLANQRRGTDADEVRVTVDGGRIYQLVTVAVRSPVPVAWITMGFALDDRAVRELASVTGLDVTLAYREGDGLRVVASTAPEPAQGPQDAVTRRVELAELGGTPVVATLSRSLAEAQAPFERLTHMLFLIGAASLVGFAWAAFWIARNITRPLQALTRAVDRIRLGAYDVALDVRRPDELGVLAEGLQLMQSAVQSRDQSIRRLAYEDTLTGLMNRTAFGAALGAALDQARDRAIAVAVVNLHRFRRINEHLGYAVGAAVLTEVAKRRGGVASVQFAVARLAGAEFAAFARLDAGADPQVWGHTLLATLTEPVLVEAQPIDISATLGIAIASAGERWSADDLLRGADLALDRAHREKRNLALYRRTLAPAARDQLSLLGELRHAVEHDELRLHFQPKIELATQRVAGVEVLLRWQHPARGLLGPAAFIPFSEQTGFIRRLTRWTLDRAIAQGAAWYRAGRALPLAVNISADDLADARLSSWVALLLTRHQLPPALLTLEITESGFIEDPERALRMLAALATLGVSLSIDDFGTGYSSLSHLARMPVQEMKIDRSFILGLESDAEYGAVVRSAIDMGHSLGLKVVAEGIEKESTAQRLRAFQCDIAQGYLYARPMTGQALQVWLVGRTRVPVIAVPRDFDIADLGDSANLATY